MIRLFDQHACDGATTWLWPVFMAVALGLAGGGWPDCAAAASVADVPVLAKEARAADQSQEVPDKVYELLGEIQRLQGSPPPGYVGGRSFQNRERRLPRGQYREYDVDPKVPGQIRGPERLVIEQRTGMAYYTKDHYRTFIKVN
jgi:guanyl-specific ribonuclease Sa